jgi:hypothetical protein
MFDEVKLRKMVAGFDLDETSFLLHLIRLRVDDIKAEKRAAKKSAGKGRGKKKK